MNVWMDGWMNGGDLVGMLYPLESFLLLVPFFFMCEGRVLYSLSRDDGKENAFSDQVF